MQRINHINESQTTTIFEDIERIINATRIEEMQELVSLLFATEHPYYCPHGRPIIIKLSLDELDRRFERI